MAKIIDFPSQYRATSDELYQLVYWSERSLLHSLEGEWEMVDILTSARSRNAPLKITGALMCGRQYFAQLLEGPRDAVLSLFHGRIKLDRRHRNVIVTQEKSIVQRAFADWSMALVPSDHQPNLLLEPAGGMNPDGLTKARISAIEMLNYLVREAQLSEPEISQRTQLYQDMDTLAYPRFRRPAMATTPFDPRTGLIG